MGVFVGCLVEVVVFIDGVIYVEIECVVLLWLVSVVGIVDILSNDLVGYDELLFMWGEFVFIFDIVVDESVVG